MINTETKVRVDIHCVKCNELHVFWMPTQKFNRWKSGEYIQNCMPELIPEQREMFITGICGKCWQRLFGE